VLEIVSKKIKSAHSTAAFGNKSELAVAHWLQTEGFKLIATNYRQRYGEIDLIVSKGELLAFVEVKARQTLHFDLSIVVTPTKQRRIAKAAAHFIAHNNSSGNHVIRFDVALVCGEDITYIPNAFVPQCE